MRASVLDATVKPRVQPRIKAKGAVELSQLIAPWLS